MLKERLSAVNDVTEKLHALEAAIDNALICAGELTSTTSAARQRANLSALVAQEAISLTGDSVAALHSARARIVDAHHAFTKVQGQLGFKTTAGGALWKFFEDSAEESPVALVHSEKTKAA